MPPTFGWNSERAAETEKGWRNGEEHEVETFGWAELKWIREASMGNNGRYFIAEIEGYEQKTNLFKWKLIMLGASLKGFYDIATHGR
jgi:hypothetical protein